MNVVVVRSIFILILVFMIVMIVRFIVLKRSHLDKYLYNILIETLNQFEGGKKGSIVEKMRIKFISLSLRWGEYYIPYK